MLSICLFFWTSELKYAYTLYAYKKKSVKAFKSKIKKLTGNMLVFFKYTYMHIYMVNTFFLSLLEKCPYSELFWSAFFCIQTEYGELRSIPSYSVRMREYADQNNSEYGHFLRIVSIYIHIIIFCSQDILSQRFSLSVTGTLIILVPIWQKYGYWSCSKLWKLFASL